MQGWHPWACEGDNTCTVQVVPLWHVPKKLNRVPAMPVNNGVVRWELEFHPSRHPFHKGEKDLLSVMLCLKEHLCS